MKQRLATPADALAIARVPSSRFESLGQVGQGAFGDVDVVRVPVKQQQAADNAADDAAGHHDHHHLLVVRKRLFRGPETELGVADWAREAAVHRLAAGSPFVLQLLAARRCRTDGLLLLTEYLAGGSLTDVLRRHQRLEEDAVRFVAACVLLALDHLHQRRVLHRDLKPCNLLLCGSTGYVRLADLGCAVILPQGQEAAFARAGSCGYRAPEVGTGRPYRERADLYSLGMTLFELAAGTLPPWAAAAKARREAELAEQQEKRRRRQRQQQQQQVNGAEQQGQQEPEPAAADEAQQQQEHQDASSQPQRPAEQPLEWPAHFSPGLCALLAQLLAHDAAARPASAAAVKQASFFAGFDFAALRSRTLSSPLLAAPLPQDVGGGVAAAVMLAQ